MNLKSKSNLNNYLDTILLASGLIWILWVFFMYLGYHPQYLQLITEHPYALLLGALFLTSSILGGWSYYKLKNKSKFSIPIRAWQFIITSLILSSIILLSYRSSVDLKLSPSTTAVIYFLLNSLFYLLLLLIVGFIMLAIGHFFTNHLSFKKFSPLLSVAVGFSVAAFISVILGLLSILYGWLLWVIFIAAVVVQRRHVFDVFHSVFLKKHTWKVKYWWELPAAFLGMVFISFYWLGGLKAYSVGFDGSALYANLAHLSTQYDYLPGAFQAYGWSLVMSWGERLFHSETMNLLLSHFMYIPALLMSYAIARMWLSRSFALLAMIIPLSMPFLGFHSMVDEKTDLGLLFISLSTVYLLLKWQAVEHKSNSFKFKELVFSSHYYPLLMIGWLLGFAFTIKYTSLFLILSVIAVALYQIANKWLYFGLILISIGLLFLTDFYEWGNISLTPQSALIIGGVLALLGIISVVYSYLKSKPFIKTAFLSVAAIGLTALLAFLPWSIKHLSEHDFNVSKNNLLYGDEDRPNLGIPFRLLSSHFNHSPSSPTKGVVRLTSEQSSNDENEEVFEQQFNGQRSKLMGNTKREELQRYLGYENGIWRYATIPTDLTFNTNISNFRHQEIGFIFLAVLPLLFFLGGAMAKIKWRQLTLLIGGIIWIAIFFWSLTEAETFSSHLEQTGIANETMFSKTGELIAPSYLHFFETIELPFVYLGRWMTSVLKSISLWPMTVYLPLMLVGLLLLSFLLKDRISTWPAGFKQLMAFCFAFFIFWLILGNAIVWYAFTPFVLLPLIILYYFEKPKQFSSESNSKYSKKLIGTVVAVQLIMNTIILFSSPFTNQESKALFQWPMIEYISRIDLDRQEVYKYYSPISQEITNEINQHPNAKVYRINTFLHYHIDKNDSRVYPDNQLGRFDVIISRLEEKSDFFKTLKANGFEYILYDLNTPNLDKTPEKSLQKKCNEFFRILKKSDDVSLLMTDHYIEDRQANQTVRLPNGQYMKAKKGFFGKTIYPGSVALFKLN